MKQKPNSVTWAIALATVLSLLAAWPCAAQFAPTDLNPVDAYMSEACAINSSGQTAGWYYHFDFDESGNIVGGYSRAVIWDSSGNMTVLDPPDASWWVEPLAMNDSGQVTGRWSGVDPESGEYVSGAFFWDSAHGMVDIGALYHDGVPDDEVYPIAINADGWVIGSSWSAVGNSWIYRDGVLEEMMDADGHRFAARAINDQGQVAGWVIGFNGTEYPGAIWEKPVAAAVPTISILTPGENARGMLINSRGQVVFDPGWWDDARVWTPDGTRNEDGTLNGSLTSLGVGGDPVLVGEGNPVYKYPYYWCPIPGGYQQALITVEGIDDSGRVYGTAEIPPASEGAEMTRRLWVWDAGAISDCLVPGDASYTTYAGWHINNSGQMAGSYSMGGVFDFTAFVWNIGETEVQNLPSLGGTYTEVFGINDAGQVAGFSTLPDDAWYPHACAWGLAAPTSALDITVLSVASPSPKSPNITVTVLITNPNDTTAYNVTVTAASLGGVDTKSALPLVYGAIKPGVSKKCTLQFKSPAPGAQTLTINGTSSLGDFFTTQTVTVP